MEELLFVNRTRYHKPSKPKRRTINLYQSQQIKREPVLNSFINPVDSQLQLDMKTTIECERNKLRILDKTAAKRIVASAEHNLINMLKSKAQVNCLLTKDNVHPFHVSLQHSPNFKRVLFNESRLSQELAKNNKYRKEDSQQSSPLIEQCRRRAFQADNRNRNFKENITRGTNEASYCGLSSQRKRKNKFCI